MKHERELCNLLIQMGLEHGVDVERVTEELAALALPSFADTVAFRSALIEAAETQLRLQVDERIRKLRQQLGVAAPPSTQGRVNFPASSSPSLTPVPEPIAQQEPQAPNSADELGHHAIAVDENLPEDRTMMWKIERE